MIDEMVLKDFLKRHVATYITAEIGTALFKMVFVAIWRENEIVMREYVADIVS